MFWATIRAEGEIVEEFQYDPQHRRDVEGWNIIFFDGVDKIGLDADEWTKIGCDFLFNEMYVEAEKSFKRGIALGSYRCVAYLGVVYQKQNRLGDAYTCFFGIGDGQRSIWGRIAF